MRWYRHLMAVSFIVTLLTIAAVAQKDDISVQVSYLRQDVEFKLPNRSDFKYNRDRDAVGFEASYVHFPWKYVGVGIEGGALFHSKSLNQVTSCGPGCTVESRGTSKVALAHASYLVQIQKRSGKLQPYFKGTVGFSRSGFGGTVFAGTTTSVKTGTLFTYGAGAGLDFKIGKKVFWRTGAAFTKGFNEDTSHFNLRIGMGLVWRL